MIEATRMQVEILEKDIQKLFMTMNWYANKNGLECGDSVPIWVSVHKKKRMMKYYCQNRITCKACATRFGGKKLADIYNTVPAIKLKTTPTFNGLMSEVDRNAELNTQLLFFTFTLPGSGHPVRHASIALQLAVIQSWFKLWLKLFNDMGMPWSGYMKVETTRNRTKRWWHTHLHVVGINPRFSEHMKDDLEAMGKTVERYAQMCGFGLMMLDKDKPILEPVDNITYLGKYMAKEPKDGWNKWETKQLVDAFKSVRQLEIFGDDLERLPRQAVRKTFITDEEWFDESYDGMVQENPLYRYW